MFSRYLYYNEYDIYDDAMISTRDIMETINRSCAEYDDACRNAKQRMLFESGFDYDDYMYESIQNVFGAIGNAIIKILQKIGEGIAAIGKKVKEVIKQFQLRNPRLQKMLHDNPELGNEVLIQFKKDELRYVDLVAFSRDYEKLADWFHKTDTATESEFKKKLDTLKKKFDDTSETIFKIGKVATTVVGTATAAITLYSIIKGISDVQKKAADNAKASEIWTTRSEKMKQQIARNSRELRASRLAQGSNARLTEFEKNKIELQELQKVQRYTLRHYNQNLSVLRRMQLALNIGPNTRLGRLIDAYEKKKTKKMLNKYTNIIEPKSGFEKDTKKKAEADTLKKKANETTITTTAKLDAEMKFNQQHATELNKLREAQAYQTAKGSEAGKLSHILNNSDIIDQMNDHNDDRKAENVMKNKEKNADRDAKVSARKVVTI